MPQESEIIHFLKETREKIISAFQALEPYGKSFQRTPWDYKNGRGGGEMAVLRGDCFEKGAVNFSAVSGDNFPMGDGQGPFFATGISLITHMMNPHAPTVHMNIRYIRTEKSVWLGGGYDLTPMGFPYQEDKEHFHNTAKKALDPHGENLYQRFSQWAKEYFYIPHYQKERGVGGIFFDHYSSGDFSADFAMWQDVGLTFLDTILPIYHQRLNTPYTEEDKKLQQKLRAHYVEFNLLYDRGTQFGFKSGGNPEAILCSMPPTASW